MRVGVATKHTHAGRTSIKIHKLLFMRIELSDMLEWAQQRVARPKNYAYAPCPPPPNMLGNLCKKCFN